MYMEQEFSTRLSENVWRSKQSFFIFGGPRGTRQKKLQNLDSIHLEALKRRFQFEKRHR